MERIGPCTGLTGISTQQFLKPNVPTPESGTIRNQDEQRRVRLRHENNVQSDAPAPLPHHDFPADASAGPSQ